MRGIAAGVGLAAISISMLAQHGLAQQPGAQQSGAQQSGTGISSKTASGSPAPAAATPVPATAPVPGAPMDRDGKALHLPTFAARVMNQWDAAIPLRLWPAGSSIDVCFFGGTAAERALVVDASRSWTAHANIAFSFGAQPYLTCATNMVTKPKLRILLNADKAKAESYAQLGTDGFPVPIERHTMAISLVTADGKRRDDKLIRRTAIHELGHTLGLPHMHQHPAAQCYGLTNWKAACRTWPKFQQIKEPVPLASYTSVNLAPRQRISGVEPDVYDPASIMHYRFPKENFTSPTPACSGEPTLDVSDGDKRLIAKLYPKNPAVQQTLIIERGVLLGRHIASIRGLTEIEAKALARYAETMVRRLQPGLPFKVDISGFQPRGRLEFAGAQWSTADKLQYGRGTEAPDRCGVTSAVAPARPAQATSPPAAPTISTAPQKPAPQRLVRRSIEVKK